MKKSLLIVFLFVLLSTIVSCKGETRQDKVLNSLGQYDSKQIWSHGEFQDYTDFGIYSYQSANLNKNEYFTQISKSDIETIYTFIDDFEKWIDTIQNNEPDSDLVINYSFDRSIIDTGDYLYIYEGENSPKFASYDVFFFDT